MDKDATARVALHASGNRSVLTTRPIRPATEVPVAVALEPVRYERTEWLAMYPYIHKLYIREGRKLKDVMSCMEREHHFVASKQMYKKRLTKWGLTKNVKQRPRIPNKRCIRLIEENPSYSKVNKAMPMSTTDQVNFRFIAKVRDWSTSYFEATSIPALYEGDFESVHYEIKLAGELLSRGHGALAGRMARKSFLSISDMLSLEAPALIWNFTELVFCIIKNQQQQLLDLLLDHALSLTLCSHSESYPLVQILRCLREECTTTSAENVLSVLSQAAFLNAEIVIVDHGHSRYTPMHQKLLWDDCSIRFPRGLLIKAESGLSKKDPHTTKPTDPETPPPDYTEIFKKNDDLIKDLCQIDLDDPRIASDVYPMRMRAVFAPALDYEKTTSGIPRLPAHVSAAIMFTVAQIYTRQGDYDRAEKCIRQSMILRELAHGKDDPRIVWSLWLLEEILVLGGRSEEATKTSTLILDTVSGFLRDVPVDSA